MYGPLLCFHIVQTYSNSIGKKEKKTGEKEIIQDFSRNIEDAVDFAELLINTRTKPRNLYTKALNYLCISI